MYALPCIQREWKEPEHAGFSLQHDDAHVRDYAFRTSCRAASLVGIRPGDIYALSRNARQGFYILTYFYCAAVSIGAREGFDMLIRDMLNAGRVTVSCELFPPKQDGDLPQGEDVVRRTAALSPDFVSVTYGASGGTSKNTVRMAEYVEQCGGRALAHLTCVSSTREEIGALLDGLAEHKLYNVLALRGDIPEGAAFPSPGHYSYASELVSEIKARGNFCIGGACYPEGHTDSASQMEDIRHLKEKVDAGCDFLTTQMFFDNNVLYRFLYRIRDAGITVPVLAGIMPVTNKKQITRIVKLSGTSLAAALFEHP